MTRSLRIDPVSLEEARKVADRRLSPEEFLHLESQPITPIERAEILDLIRWFRGRYKTPAERLAYARKAYRRWTARAPR